MKNKKKSDPKKTSDLKKAKKRAMDRLAAKDQAIFNQALREFIIEHSS